MKLVITFHKVIVLLLIQAVMGNLQYLVAQELDVKFSEYQYVMKKWDNTTGLPVNMIFKTIKDDEGFLWVVSEEGVIRFDGVNFKVFDQDYAENLISPMFYNLSKSSSGGIWASSTNTVVKFDINRIQIFDASEHASGTYIQAISEDQNQNLLVGTNDGKLLILREGNFEMVPDWLQMESGGIRTIEKFSDGNLIGTRSGLFFRYSATGEVNQVESFEGMEVRAIAVHPDGSLWIGTRTQGVFKVQNNVITQFNTQNGLKNNYINTLAFDKDGKVWVGFNFHGFQIIDGSELISIRDIGFEQNEVMDIYISDSETIWLSVVGIGVVQLNVADVQMLREEDGLSYDITLAIYEDPDGVIWSSTPGAGVNRIEGLDITHISTDDGLSHGAVLSIFGADEYIYFGTGMNLNRYNRIEKRVDRIFTTSDGLASDVIPAIYQDSQSRVWIATLSGGIHQLIDHDEILKLEVPEAYENADFINISEDSAGNLWFGTSSVGVLKLDVNGDFKGYSMGHGPTSEIVLDTYEDPEGSMWFGTNEGLLLKEGEEEFRLFNRKNGLQFDGIFRIIEDDRGYVWTSGNFGIQRIRLSDLMKLKRSKSDTERIPVRLFDTSDGMANHETNGGVFPAGWKLKNGEIWFPTMQGIAKIDPSKLSEPETSLRALIESVAYGGEEFDAQNELIIPAGVHNLEIKYSSFDFRKPHTINHSFRILGLHQDWQPVGNRKVIYLTGLSPGSYTFEVKAEQFGNESEIASLNFRMEPFFHQTTVFKILVLAGLFLGGFFARKLYATRKLEYLLREKVGQQTIELKDRNIKLKRALNDIEHQNMVFKAVAWVQSHELRGPLSRMMGLIDILKNYDQYRSIKKGKAELLSEIDESAKELDKIIRKLNKDLENLEE